MHRDQQNGHDHVKTNDHLADILTKALAQNKVIKMGQKLGVQMIDLA